ncbi:MAG TPA: aminotransferase class V-fold PLP-dependent enzyme [Thermoanaerobaculia bacterium]|nr:aminotransferase class V-fold PLP-dependent enzyme [Thermoanaerobaculia bacterium]
MLTLPAETRGELWQRLVEAIERYTTEVGEAAVAPAVDVEAFRDRLSAFDFGQPMEPLAALDFAVQSLWRGQVHTPHPRYFGLFNPAPATMGIAGDALAAAFNPQLATWSHSPFATEVEQHLVRAFAERFGYDPARTEGTFTSGGAEANHTALLLALTRTFPEVARRGLLALRSQPVVYVTAETHHSVLKAARLSGIGTEAIREVRLDSGLRMRPDALAERIREDREAGCTPFLVVATAGTTGSGAVDPLAEIAEIADEERLWLHVDAAWGGAAALVPELRHAVEGIARASSITFDAHKWLSVPMGAGLFLTRHTGLLERTFRVATGYMPHVAGQTMGDPYAHTMQWSRRFIGLKVFLALAVAGWEGYEQAIRHQTAMGDLLRRRLTEEGWTVVNDTPLPLVNFVDGGKEGRGAYLEALAADVVASGEAWISVAQVGELGPALRACITHFGTGPEDLERLIRALDQARARQSPRSEARSEEREAGA